MNKTHNSPTPLLRMEHIGKSFSGVRVLEDVGFDLYPGEVHILAGENGAGKTTLIKILAGVHTEYQGNIFLQDRPVRFRSPHEASMQGISAIHQEMSLVPSMSVGDNIFLGRERTRLRLWMDFASQREKAESLLSRLGIAVSLDRSAEEYPVSVRQMIEIAKALVHDARIIIMDEPTSALSDIEAEKLFEIIRDLKAAGCGIIFISHRMEEIYKIGDRISVLRDGRHVGTSEVRDLPPDKLIHWMVGRDIRQQYPPREGRSRDLLLQVRHFSLPDPSGTKKWIVEDVGFDLQAGEILGIAGLQGSGKSELFLGLFGALGRNDSGEVLLDGKPFSVRSPRHSIANGLVLLTNDRQGTGLVPLMNIARNISLASIPDFSPGGWMQADREEEAAREYVRSFDIRIHSLEQEVRTLSGGNQQKVVLAKWLQTNPKVLLLDEPTIGVDVGAKHEIYRLMNTWTDEGKGILLITSELPELLAMSDRILVMHRGRVVREFQREEADQKNIIGAAMGGENI